MQAQRERLRGLLRPRLPRDNPSYCDGTYTVQHGRRTRCALTEIGVQYWQHAPAVFNWNPDIDHSPCPLAWTYQLVRNVLAATVRKDRVETASGHALIIYDERNPAFWPGGNARSAYDAVCTALRHPGLLRTVSWQRVIDQLSRLVISAGSSMGLKPNTGSLTQRQCSQRLWVVFQDASSQDLPSPGTGTTDRGTVSADFRDR